MPCAEELARAAQLQVQFGNLKAVGGFGDGAQALGGRGIDSLAGHEKAKRLPTPAPDAAAELVQLRETKSLRVLDQHRRGVGHVHADLDDRGRDQHLDIPGLEVPHGRFLFLARQAAVQQAHSQFREDVAPNLVVHAHGGA